MTLKTHATIEDLYQVEGKAEIINGEVVEMAATGIGPGYAGDEIFASLREYARRTGRGRAVGDGKGFRVDLPNRESFSPDAAFFTGPRGPMLRFFEGTRSSPSRCGARATRARPPRRHSRPSGRTTSRRGRWSCGT